MKTETRSEKNCGIVCEGIFQYDGLSWTDGCSGAKGRPCGKYGNKLYDQTG